MKKTVYTAEVKFLNFSTLGEIIKDFKNEIIFAGFNTYTESGFLEDFFEDRKLKVKSDFLNEKARKKDSSKVFVFITKDSIYKLRYEFITEKLESFITIGEIEDYYKSNIINWSDKFIIFFKVEKQVLTDNKGVKKDKKETKMLIPYIQVPGGKGQCLLDVIY